MSKDEGAVEATAAGGGAKGLRRITKLMEPTLNNRHRIMTDKRARDMSVLAVQMGVLADSVSTTILQPNFPFIVRPGAHEDSFDSTDPFDANGATYFLPMCALFGAAITSAFIGSLSDKIGRKPCMMACLGVSVLGNLAKYYARHSFWAFCACNFFNGLFGASVPIALAYVSDMHPNRAEKDKEIGIMIGYYMIGMAGGGIAAILLESNGLFIPLFLGAALNFFSYVLLAVYMIEPSPEFAYDEEVMEEDVVAEHMNWPVFWNVVAGALADNIGSVGLFPLALTPLAFEKYLGDFILAGEDPILKENPYRWLSVLVAIMVVPGAGISPMFFDKFGAPMSCVMANLLTAVGIVACMYIVEIDPPSTGTLVGFIVVLYGIYPFTVISQLTTGPMLDMLAPPAERGFAQGINVTVMNFANAVTPFIIGTMADELGTIAALWTCTGVSIAAAIINYPLVFAPDLQRAHHDDSQHALVFEDEEIVAKAMRGEPVPLQAISEINGARMQQGLPFLVPPVGAYEDDKARMQELKKSAVDDYIFTRARMYNYLNEMADPEKKAYMAAAFAKAKPSEEQMNHTAEQMGKWFGDYLKDMGYLYVGHHATIYKKMIMNAFPQVLKDHHIDGDVLEATIVKYISVLNKHLDESGPQGALKGFRNGAV